MYYRCTNPADMDRAARDDTGILRRRSRLRDPAHFDLAGPPNLRPLRARGADAPEMLVFAPASSDAEADVLPMY